jgi:beta-lactam-binding protein with PASTA domain
VQKKLDKAKLLLAPKIRTKRVTGKQVGTVVAQSPAAGSKVKIGTVVTIQMGVGSSQIKVPSVGGMTPVEADAALRKIGLLLGAVSPKPDPKAKIATQIPAVGQSVKAGTPVNVFLVTPALAQKPKGKGANGKKAAAAAVAAAGAAGATAATASAALKQQGLVPQSVKVISTQPAGTVLQQTPPKSAKIAKGTTVQLLVSAGYPDIAYDDGKHVFVAKNGGGGKPVQLGRGKVNEEPTWSANGKRLAFVSDGRVVLANPAKPAAKPRALTPAGTKNWHDPAFAPAAQAASVLAVLRVGDAQDGDLCLLDVATAPSPPDCIADPAWKLTHQIAWAPDGKTILVVGQNAANPKIFAVLRYTSSVPFSTRASDWGTAAPVTDVTHPGVGFDNVALSPDGKQAALVGNQGSSALHVLLAPFAGGNLGQPKSLPVRACDVAWRADGRELLVTQEDAVCADGEGTLVRLDPASPTKLTQVDAQVAHPAFQPLVAGR